MSSNLHLDGSAASAIPTRGIRRTVQVLPSLALRIGEVLLMPALIIIIAGCSRDDTCPVTGKLVVNGEPAEGAYVVFHSLDDPKQASPDSARTLKDGTFAGRVRQPGQYAVAVFWPMITEEEGDVVEGDDRFEGKYRNPTEPVLKVTIQNGENALSPININYPDR